MAIKRKTQSRRQSPSSKRPTQTPGVAPRDAERMAVYRGRGSARPAPPAQPRPAALSLAEKTKLLAGVALPGPGTVYVTLRPSYPFVANQAALVFERARVIDCGWDYATWRLWLPNSSPSIDSQLTFEEGKGVKRLGIWFKSEAAGRRYLVDCTVNGGGPGNWGSSTLLSHVFSVFSGNSLMQETTVPHEGGHVTFVVETQDANWYGFMLMSNPSWTFWSCEITRL